MLFSRPMRTSSITSFHRPVAPALSRVGANGGSACDHTHHGPGGKKDPLDISHMVLNNSSSHTKNEHDHSKCGIHGCDHDHSHHDHSKCNHPDHDHEHHDHSHHDHSKCNHPDHDHDHSHHDHSKCNHPDHDHEHHDHSHHDHEHKKEGILKQILTPTNLILMLSTLSFADIFHKLSQKAMSMISSDEPTSHDVHDHGHPQASFANYILYAAQIVAGIAIWTTLAKFVPLMNVRKGRIIVQPTESFAKHKGQISKILSDAKNDLRSMSKFIALVVGSYTAIQIGTDTLEEKISPDNTLARNVLKISSLALKVSAMIASDAIVNDRALNLSAFGQSLTEACACCSMPRVACVQVAPIFTDLYSQAVNGGLSSHPPQEKIVEITPEANPIV